MTYADNLTRQERNKDGTWKFVNGLSYLEIGNRIEGYQKALDDVIQDLIGLMSKWKSLTSEMST